MAEDKQKFKGAPKQEWKSMHITMTDHDDQISELTEEFTQRDNDLQAKVDELTHQVQQLEQNQIPPDKPPD